MTDNEMGMQEAFFHLIHGFKRAMRGKIVEMELTQMQVRVLKIIDRVNSCTAQVIADYVARDKAQITRLLKDLVDQGLIQKVDNPSDKRSQLLVPTELGCQCIKQIKTAERQVVKKMSRGMDKSELEQFNQLAQRMIENLSN